MFRDKLTTLTGVIAGFLFGIILWAAILGVQVHREQPGLWTARAARIVNCGVDYSGPPFNPDTRTLWLTCGGEDQSVRLWPFPWR